MLVFIDAEKKIPVKFPSLILTTQIVQKAFSD